MNRKKLTWWVVGALVVLGLFGLLRLGIPTQKLLFLYSKNHLPSLTQELRKTTVLPPSLAVYVSAPGLSQEQVQQLRTKIISELGITEVPYSKEKLMFLSLSQGRHFTIALTYYPADSVQPTHLSKVIALSLRETLGMLLEK